MFSLRWYSRYFTRYCIQDIVVTVLYIIEEMHSKAGIVGYSCLAPVCIQDIAQVIVKDIVFKILFLRYCTS